VEPLLRHDCLPRRTAALPVWGGRTGSACAPACAASLTGVSRMLVPCSRTCTRVRRAASSTMAAPCAATPMSTNRASPVGPGLEGAAGVKRRRPASGAPPQALADAAGRAQARALRASWQRVPAHRRWQPRRRRPRPPGLPVTPRAAPRCQRRSLPHTPPGASMPATGWGDSRQAVGAGGRAQGWGRRPQARSYHRA
jgi:hypothetical protein